MTLLDQSGLSSASVENFVSYYWYGRVTKSWTTEDGLSVNTPTYNGDKCFEDISYMTIDVMALLTVAKRYPELLSNEMKELFIEATKSGKLWLFVQEDLFEIYNVKVDVMPEMASFYAAGDSAYCLSNIIWACKDLSFNNS